LLFASKDKPGLHASSGFTRNFQPKPSFHALAHLYRTLGEYRFHRLVTNEPTKLRIQEYRHGNDAKKMAWAVWSNTGEGRSVSVTLDRPPGRLVDAQCRPLTATAASFSTRAKQNPDGRIEAQLDESPLYLLFESP
jgi:hypothetical protein